MSADLDLTLAAIRTHGWRCVLLGPRLKRPVTPQWVTTTDADRVAEWFSNKLKLLRRLWKAFL